MSRHNEMLPVPLANRSHKGTGDDAKVSKDTSKKKGEVNTATPPILSGVDTAFTGSQIASSSRRSR